MQQLTRNSYVSQPAIEAVRQFHWLDTLISQTQEFTCVVNIMETERLNAVLFFTPKQLMENNLVDEF
jgi:hypothetical protein